MIELKDYELIPSDEDEQAWNVRALTGKFNETILRFGSIAFNESKEGVMTFNFHIVYSPDDNITTENVELQEYAGDLLQAIIRDGIETGSVITKEKDSE
tara:strand:+ start:1994 stop:2290 length:297 start_codon:yes stop_codon:yes gene_type:complete